MAINTQNVYLLKGVTSSGTTTWSKLIDIKDFPDLGSSVSQIETTTLSNTSQTYIDGIHQIEALEFNANYTKSDFTTLYALETAHDILDYAICFKKTTSGSTTSYGSDGVFKIKGYLNVGVSGAGVDEVVEMKITITPTEDIEFSETALTIS